LAVLPFPAVIAVVYGRQVKAVARKEGREGYLGFRFNQDIVDGIPEGISGSFEAFVERVTAH